MDCISFDNIGWAPVGLVTLVAANVARIFEGALVCIVNFFLAVKNCICGPAEEVKVDPKPDPVPEKKPDPKPDPKQEPVVEKPRFSKKEKVAGSGVTGATAGAVATYVAATALGLTAWPVVAALGGAAALGAATTYGANKYVKDDAKPQQPAADTNAASQTSSN